MTTKIQPPPITSASFSLSTQSPSFSSENIADIAARVVKELNLSSDDPFDDDFYSNAAFNDLNDTVQVIESQPSDQNQDNDENDDDNNNDVSDEESEFEFAILNSSPISADEIFSNGQIKPIYPVFDTNLIYGHQNNAVSITPQPQTLRLPLRKLLQENKIQNGTVSSSSSEADELEGVPPGTYCVWTPKKKEEIVQMRKKSKSTGFPSKRWRFKDLLHRSNSDGKDTFVFLTPAGNGNSKVNGNGNGDGKRRDKSTVVRKSGVDGKKKSYLPYRQDLVGFFANVNGISRTVRPF